MNCIFVCVFYEKKYIDMLYLLLESIFIYGNLDKNTNVLIYTSTLFMNIIKQSRLFNSEKIMFELNDTYNSIDSACKARLDLFTLHSISNYNKILYLDTDVLVKYYINKVFDVCQEDILYALEEGEIGHEFWGKTLFGREIHNYSDKTAFSSGVLLFNNCEKIKDLFRNIKEDIIKRPYNFVCYDQPYIVYNAFKYNLYNNKVLKSLVVNNDTNIHSNKVIHHFPGGPGIYQHKIVYMNNFLNNIKLYTLNIPKILFQTNKTTNDIYVLDMIKDKLGSGWKYEFYNDADVCQFFINNPIFELPDIIQKYNSIKKGAHKADLFRYYYLYINGGFFMDSDAMLYVNIDTIVKDYSFVSVNSSCHPGTIFQGILGASRKNKIIKKALYRAYNTDPNILDKHYHYFCKQLYDIIKENDYGYNIKLYEERRTNEDKGDDILNGRTLLFKHYWKHKVIPPVSRSPVSDWAIAISKKGEPYYWNKITRETRWDNPEASRPIGDLFGSYNKNELKYFDYRILNTYVIPNKFIRVGPKEDGGYVIADGFYYDLFISCGIASDIRFEDEFLNIHKIKCIAFDGTINSFPRHKNSMEWIPKNISFSNTEKTTNLKEYIQNSNKIFLKMDIEGSEFEWLESMSETELEKFSQIVLEVHCPFDIYRMNMLKKLNESHYIIHIHGNNYCDRDIPKHLPSGRSYDGTFTIDKNSTSQIKLPEVFEVTYINKKLCDSTLVEMKEIIFPTKLDYPNNPNANDICFSIPI